MFEWFRRLFECEIGRKASVRLVPPDLSFRVSQLTLRPGDLGLLKTDSHLSDAAVKSIKATWDQVVAGSNKCIVLAGGMDLDVIRREEQDQPLEFEVLKNGEPCNGTATFHVGDEISVRLVAHRPIPPPPPPLPDDVPFKRG